MDLNLDLLKLSNIFRPINNDENIYNPVGFLGRRVHDSSPTFPDSGVISPHQSMPNDNIGGDDIMSSIQGMLNPREEQFNRLTELISGMPRRDDYKPSIGRRILAGLAGIGDRETGEAVREAPYNRALTEWKNELEPLEKVAGLEGQRNVQNRATALGTLTRQQAQDKLDQQVKYQDEEQRRKAELAESQLAKDKAYIAAKEFAITNPDYEGKVDENGILVYVNKNNPAEVIRTDIKTGDLGDIQKHELNIKGEMSKIAARGAESRKTQTASAENKLNDDWELFNTPDGKTVRINRSTGDVQPVDISNLTRVSGAGASARPQSEADKKTGMQNRANTVMLEHPEWSKYITVQNGQISVSKPGGYFGPDQKTYDAIVQAITGKATANTEPAKPQSSVQPTQSTQPTRELSRQDDARTKAARAKVEPGNVLITDGKNFGQIKPADVSKLPKGWMVVK